MARGGECHIVVIEHQGYGVAGAYRDLCRPRHIAVYLLQGAAHWDYAFKSVAGGGLQCVAVVLYGVGDGEIK